MDGSVHYKDVYQHLHQSKVVMQFESVKDAVM